MHDPTEEATVRREVAAAAAGALLAVAAGVPVAWLSSRPEAAVGAPVTAGPQATDPATSTDTATDTSTATTDPATAVPAPARGAPAPDVLPALNARSAAPAAQLPAVAPAPSRVDIAGLGIRADVLPVGVRPDGAMDLPEDGADLGWYRHGPAPGADSGSAVIAGHVDTRRYGPGALFPLQQVQPGTEVVVTLTDGSSTRWQVTGRQRIEKAALPVEDLFRRDGAPRLVLVTCGGEYLPEVPGYRDNVVVVAEPLP